MKTTRIALITDKYLPIFGGLELLLRDLAHQLVERGYEPHVICATPGPPDTERFPVVRLDGRRILYRACTPRTYTDLHAYLAQHRFDLIHAHCVFSPLAHAAIRWAKTHRIPSILTVHSDLRGPGGILLSSLRHLTGWSEWPTVLSAVSQYVADDLAALSGRSDIEVALNAAHLDRWTVPAGARPNRIASAMRFTIRKRPLDMVRIVPRLQERLDRSRWPQVTIVGDGPERRRVEREIRRLGLGDRVELTGELSQTRLVDVLARSSIFAVPSKREALSIAAIEARAAGLPVVARIPSGVSEVVEHGRHGLLASSDGGFLEALIQLIASPALRAKLSSQATTGLERFGWPASMERIERLYRLAKERI